MSVLALGHCHRNVAAGFDVRVIETAWVGGTRPPAHRFGLEVRPDSDQAWQRRRNGLSWSEATAELELFLSYQTLPPR